MAPGGAGGVRLLGIYARRTSDAKAELVLCLDGGRECIGCAGVEGEGAPRFVN